MNNQMELFNLSLLILIIYVNLLVPHNAWLLQNKPRIFGDKIPEHLLIPSSKKVQHKIVKYHNFFRSRVTPSSSDMLMMSWHKEAAEAAQNWANRCLNLNHDTANGRWIQNFGSCGQNIFISSHHVPWFFAIKMWFMEKQNFTYGSPNNFLESVGHYTQLVWSTTHKVGCGFKHCKMPYNGKPYFNYVCNYCPMGNHQHRLGKPYKKGKPCNSCPKHCSVKNLCTNACPTADMWANCKDLYKIWPKWLCHTNETNQGKERLLNCNATCTCQDKIM